MGALIGIFISAIIITGIFLVVLGAGVWISEDVKTNKVKEVEAARGNHAPIETFDAKINGEDLPKLGRFTAARIPVKLTFVLNQVQRTINVGKIEGGYDLVMLDIDFNAQYTHQTTKSGIGRAVVGGAVAGTAGAIIGGSTGKTTTVDTEVESWALITACQRMNPGTTFGFRMAMTTELYQKLQANYVRPTYGAKTREKKRQALVAKKAEPAIDSLTALVKLRDQGILTDGEFAEKAAKLAK